MRAIPLSLLTVLFLATTTPALAQRGGDRSPVAVAFSASTLGLGPELSLHLTDRFGLRAGYHFFSLSTSQDVEDISYTLEPDWRNLTALADFHPFGSAFRLTGGLVLWNTKARADAELNQPVEIGDRTYQPSEVGSLTFLAEYPRSVAPMVGLGIASRGRFAVTFDLGVVFAGHPTVDLTVVSPLTGPERATLEAEVAKEEAEIQASINDEPLARLYPVVSLGLKWRF